MFETIRADMARARIENFIKPGFWNQHVWIYLQPNSWIVIAYRFNRWARQIRIPVLRQILLILGFIARRLVEVLTGVFVAPTAQIGPGFVVHNLYGVIVGGVKIGKNCTVFSGTKIGYQVKKIGDDVSIGLGAVIVESVTIGNNVRVAPNSVVITDVPDNTTIMGVPARIRLRRAPLKPGAPMVPTTSRPAVDRTKTPAQKLEVKRENAVTVKNGLPVQGH